MTCFLRSKSLVLAELIFSAMIHVDLLIERAFRPATPDSLPPILEITLRSTPTDPSHFTALTTKALSYLLQTTMSS
jgi:hypothetical protein